MRRPDTGKMKHRAGRLILSINATADYTTKCDKYTSSGIYLIFSCIQVQHSPLSFARELARIGQEVYSRASNLTPK